MIGRQSLCSSRSLTWELLPESTPSEFPSNEQLLMILNKNSGLAPYTHSFSKEGQDPQILSGFVTAMTDFMGELIGENKSNWKTVYGSDSILLVEVGKWAIGVLIASRETDDNRSKLRSIVREFEDCFEFLKNTDGIDGNIFKDYDDFVRRVFVCERITDRTLVTKMYDWRTNLEKFNLPSTAFKVSKLLLGFEITESVGNIANLHTIPIKEVIEIISKAYWNGCVRLHYIPADDDILGFSEKATSLIFHKENPLKLSNQTLSVVSLLDNRTPLSNFTKDMTIQDQELLLAEVGTLINRGFIQRISVEKRLVLLNESALSNLVSKSVTKIGKSKIIDIFHRIRKQGMIYHPRISRIMLMDNMLVRCILEEHMTPIDLDDMCDTLEYFIKEMVEHLSRMYGKRTADTLIREAREESKRIWALYLKDVVI
ncbi:MAG: hypothetical protein ACTSSD_11435 [Candidatus Thorarchaeota archaeon]